MMMVRNLTEPIGLDEHVFVAGMTGSGKSFLVEKYLSQFPRFAMLDVKNETLDKIARGIDPLPDIDKKKLTIITKVAMLHEVHTPYIVYAPDFDEQTEYHYDEFFKWCYYKRVYTVWVDEAMAVSPNPHSIPLYYKACLTRGRSRGTAVWSCTQRPAGLASIILSQTTHFFIFNLQLQADRKRIVETTGVPEFMEKPGKYNFWYFKDGWEDAVKARLVEG